MMEQRSSLFLILIIFAGFPTAIQKSGISFVTTELAPITQFLPIFTFGNMADPIPIQLPSPIWIGPLDMIFC
jgi:hypothetical protein